MAVRLPRIRNAIPTTSPISPPTTSLTTPPAPLTPLPSTLLAPATPQTPPSADPAPRASAGAPPRLGQALAEKVLDDLVIYRLGAEPLARLREAGLVPGAVTVTARGVEITLQRVATEPGR